MFVSVFHHTDIVRHWPLLSPPTSQYFALVTTRSSSVCVKAATAAVQCIDVNILVSFYYSAFRRSYGNLTRRTLLKNMWTADSSLKKIGAKEALCNGNKTRVYWARNRSVLKILCLDVISSTERLVFILLFFDWICSIFVLNDKSGDLVKILCVKLGKLKSQFCWAAITAFGKILKNNIIWLPHKMIV